MIAHAFAAQKMPLKFIPENAQFSIAHLLARCLLYCYQRQILAQATILKVSYEDTMVCDMPQRGGFPSGARLFLFLELIQVTA